MTRTPFAADADSPSNETNVKPFATVNQSVRSISSGRSSTASVVASVEVVVEEVDDVDTAVDVVVASVSLSPSPPQPTARTATTEATQTHLPTMGVPQALRSATSSLMSRPSTRLAQVSPLIITGMMPCAGMTLAPTKNRPSIGDPGAGRFSAL